MDRKTKEPGKAVGFGLGSRRTDAKSDLAEELSLLRRNEIQVVKRSRELLASLVDYVECDAPEPAFDRQGEGERPGLLELVVAGTRWQVEGPQLDSVLLGGAAGPSAGESAFGSPSLGSLPGPHPLARGVEQPLVVSLSHFLASLGRE